MCGINPGVLELHILSSSIRGLRYCLPGGVLFVGLLVLEKTVSFVTANITSTCTWLGGLSHWSTVLHRCVLSQTLAQPLEGQAGTASNDQTPLTSFLTSQIVCEYAAEYVHPLENA
jgi:hypothetical protein